MQQQTYLPTDLVFTISGGPRDGELLPVKARKCVLAFEDEPSSGAPSNRSEKPRIAIYRGSSGVTVRIYGGEILVNGDSKDSHWLENGDEIQFPNAVVLQVTQIGSVTAEPVPNEPDFDPPVPAPEPFSDLHSSHAATPDPPESQQKLDRLETQVSEIQQQNQQVQGRFNELDQRLSQLTDQLSTLVTLATQGPLSESTNHHDQPSDFEAPLHEAPLDVASLNEAPLNEAPLSPARRSAETVTDFTVDNERFQVDSQKFDSRNFGSQKTSQAIDDNELLQYSEIDSQPIPTEIETNFQSAPEYTTDPAPASEPEFVAHPQNNHELESELAPKTEAAHEDVKDHEPVGFDAQTEIEGHSDFSEETALAVGEESESESIPSSTSSDSNSSESKPSESVADLLARMKAEGQWNGVEGNDDDEKKTPDVTSPITMGVLVSPSQTMSAPGAEAADAKSASSVEPDVEDYMSQLLSRMRGGADPAPQPAAVAPQPESEKDDPATSVPAEVVEPMTQEEFVPKQRAAKLESLGAMRELANSTARTAVADSEEDRRKALAFVQLAISIGSLIMALYYSLFLCKSLGDTHSIISVICLGLSGFLGYRFYTTMYPKAMQVKAQA